MTMFFLLNVEERLRVHYTNHISFLFLFW